MKILNFTLRILILGIFFSFPGCTKPPEPDPCLLTKWSQTKEYEIKLAVHVSTSNPTLPGGSPGSQNPKDFQMMAVNGTIEKIDCGDVKEGTVSIGNTYLTKGVDLTAPINVSDSYWIGHVVYVYEFGNDKEHLNVNLTVKITMMDGQSYTCNISFVIDSQQVVLVPGETYYYILMDVSSDLWVKV